MEKFLEQMRRWGLASEQTLALLHRNSELCERRVQLIRRNLRDMHALVRAAREFNDLAGRDQEPAARSGSPRSR